MSAMDDTINQLENKENTLDKGQLALFIKDSLLQIKKINESYKKLFENDEDRKAIILEIEERLGEISRAYDDLFKKNNLGISKISELSTKLEEIRNYHKELLEGEASIKTDIAESQEKITNFYVYLFGGDEGSEGERKKIEAAIEAITNFHGELTKENGYIKVVENAHKEILDIYNGFYAESEGVPSRISELRKDIVNIESFGKKVKEELSPLLEKKQEAIKKIEKDIATKQTEIGSLLSAATIGTLAQGYLESMQNYGSIRSGNRRIEVINFLKNLFNYCLFIAPLILICLIFVQPEILRKLLGLDQLTHVSFSGTEYVFYKISVSLPLLWVSWYGQKNISYRRRLFEEYNHKLRVVQMYILFVSKNETYKLSDKSGLEKILLDVISRNPSEVYGKDETILDKIIEVIGLRKTTTQIIKDGAEKIVEGATNELLKG